MEPCPRRESAREITTCSGRHLQSILLARIGPAATTNVNWEFHTIDERDICRVHVEPSDFPVYDTKGEEAVFWCRYQTGTTAIRNELDRDRIIARRWGSAPTLAARRRGAAGG